MKVLLALFFLVSALAKFIGIDSFEIYLYSLHLLPLTACQVLARVVVAGELWLAIVLLSGHRHRFALHCLLLALLLFTGVLALLALRGHSDNCHCMGELMAFSPMQSILKNAVLLLGALFVRRYDDGITPPRRWVIILLVIATCEVMIQCGYWGLLYLNGYQRNFLYVWMLVLSVTIVAATFCMHWRWTVWLLAAVPLVTIFILSPPDGWRHRGEELRYNRDMLVRQLNDGGTGRGSALQEGHRVVAFYSTSCHYCQTAAQKMGTLQEELQLADSIFVNVFPQSRDGALEAFYAASRSPRYAEMLLPVDTFLQLTYGQFPLVMLLREGEPVACLDFRDIDETTLSAFLSDTTVKQSFPE